MAKIYERLLSIQTNYGKTGGTRLIPNVKICWARIVFVMVILLETPRVIFIFFIT